MTLVLYALNRRYYLNENGAFTESQKFPVVPAGFHSEVASVLGEQRGTAREMEQRAARLKLVADGLRRLCENGVASGSGLVRETPTSIEESFQKTRLGGPSGIRRVVRSAHLRVSSQYG